MSNNFSLILTKKRIKMITKNEKAKGLWWRLLATLPVLAILMIANTKVTAQENKAVDKPITIEMGQFEIYDDDGTPIHLSDTTIYNEDGSSIKIQVSDAFDPITEEPCKKITVSTYNTDGTKDSFFITETEKRGDTARYSIEPFSISESLFETLLDVATSKEDTVYQVVDKMPEFPGGEKAMMEFLSKNIVYPEKAKEAGIQGRVFVGFVIEKDGSVSEVKIMKGVGGECDEEALRVVKSMPKWKPGKKDGKSVRVSYTLPINFKLTEDQTKKSDNASDKKPDKNGVYRIVEEMPRFPGDDKALMEYIQKNLIMPEKYKGNTDENPSLAEYRTFVQFVVNEDGSISDIQLLRKSAEFKDLDNEAIRVVKAMPNWEPGKIGGKPVKVYFNLPIIFKFKK